MNFTVLMSLYIKEEAQYLDECLNSLHNQTSKADEIIIVLDGPITKDLDSILFKWQQILPIKFVPITHNVGLGRALNKGLEHCSHEWIFRMDTDDICLPTRFEEQISYIKSNPETVLIGGQIKEYSDLKSKHCSSRIVPNNSTEIYNYAKIKNPFNHVTVAFQKTAILELGGYQHHLYMEDYNLWLRVIAKHKDIHNLTNTLVNVRSGNAMLARRKGISYIKSEWQLFKLKNNLGYHRIIKGIAIFLIRSIPRLLPTFILARIYASQRE